MILFLLALIASLPVGQAADYPLRLTPQEAARANSLAEELGRFPDDYRAAAAEIVDRLTRPDAALDREPPPDASTVRPYTISGAAVALAAILYGAWRYVSRRRSRGKRETQTRKRQA